MCGKSMALVAQLHHHPQRLDLGGDGRCLFVFMCSDGDSQCIETWDYADGGNTAFVLLPEELVDGPSWPPDVADPGNAQIRCTENCSDDDWDPERTIWINTEVQVVEWQEREDSIPESLRAAFLDPDQLDAMPHELKHLSYQDTKLGSVPVWVQRPHHRSLAFLGQFAPFFDFTGPVPSADEVGSAVVPDKGATMYPATYRLDGPGTIFERLPEAGEDATTWSCCSPNYGDAGMGYLLLEADAEGVPQVRFSWSCH